MRLVILFAMVILTGCHRIPLDMRSQYLYPEYLASDEVSTPDPCNRCFYGQQIVAFWDVPKVCLPCTLKINVRYGTGEIAQFFKKICTSKGSCQYQFIQDEYFDCEGIVSFKGELFKDNQLIADWKHSLWVEIIHF